MTNITRLAEKSEIITDLLVWGERTLWSLQYLCLIISQYLGSNFLPTCWVTQVVHPHTAQCRIPPHLKIKPSKK
uniref:Uncharacterized protein n=1 Tax=Cairina moschata TaxID=8855 RepID=A0A8C3C6H1_CAIMO